MKKQTEKTMYEDEFRKMDIDDRVEFKVTGGRVKKRRFRLNQNDTPESAMKKMEKQKKTKKKGRHSGVAKKMNIVIAMLRMARRVFPDDDTNLAQKKKELWDKIP